MQVFKRFFRKIDFFLRFLRFSSSVSLPLLFPFRFPCSCCCFHNVYCPAYYAGCSILAHSCASYRFRLSSASVSLPLLFPFRCFVLCLLRPNRIWARLCRPFRPSPAFLRFFSFFSLQNLHIPNICCTFAPGFAAVIY